MGNKNDKNCTASYILNVVINELCSRYDNKLLIRKTPNNFHRTSMSIGAPKIWNQLPNDIRIIKKHDNFVAEISKISIRKCGL